MPRKIRVLIVDDSALVRNILQNGLNQTAHIEVVATAPDPYIARDLIVQKRPDVITLDVEMPRMDGIEFLTRIMKHMPTPVIICSSLSKRGSQITLDALDHGAIDFVTKPDANVDRALSSMMKELIQKVTHAARVDVSHWKDRIVNQNRRSAPALPKALSVTTDKVIAIGASTGGTQALKDLLYQMPVTSPGIVIVQHMPVSFTQMFAERLNKGTGLHIKEAEHGDRISPGKVFIAPGGTKHMSVKRVGGFYQIQLSEGEKVNGHCPSVDVLFNSIAEYCGKNAIGCILTGMGNDGAKGLLKMKQNGAKTIGQDEASSIVYGMPKAAYDLGAVDIQRPLKEIPEKLIELFMKRLPNA